MIKVKIKKLRDDARVPIFGTAGSAGCDVFAAIDEEIIIQPMQRALIPTGIAVQIPAGYEIQIRSRSGLSWKHGLVVCNSPGTIDSDYRGEIKVILTNLGNEDFVIKPQMKIAQMVLQKVEKIDWQESDNLDDSDRNEGGFGSTGH